MTTIKRQINGKTIEQVTALLDGFRGVPEGFSGDFRTWAIDWNDGDKETYHQRFKQWSIEIRPYSVTELAKQAGMPGRTLLTQIIKDLEIPSNEMRNSGGQLTPQAVSLIVDEVSRPTGFNRKAGG